MTIHAAPTGPALRIDPRDDVAVAICPIAAGEQVTLGDVQVTATAEIPRGHKLALRRIPVGVPVHKYGWPIGLSTREIAPGDHVHAHNVRTRLSGTLAYRYQPDIPTAATAAPVRPGFLGYRRADGRVGTRNEIWILCTVGCVGRTAERIATLAAERFAGRVDGIHAFPHPYGCSQLGDDLSHTRDLIAALARHPNAGGVLILGLGCESNQLDRLLDQIGRDSRIRAFTAQTAADEVEDGLAAVEALVAQAEQDRRSPCAFSDLVIGLKCGGSDGFSGLTANPLVGRIADRLALAGGTPVLAEIPEIFGAEELLMRRAADQAVFNSIVGLVNGFKQYFLEHNQPVYENPSPGNIAGGITTLEEKSLGAVQKGGRTAVTQVLRYGEQIHRPGLALLESPGNDAVSSTALTAAGATLLLFTTGRGTPLGFPVPTLKLASNPDLAARKPHWIDFDAGMLLQGQTMEQAADALQTLILTTASGQPTRNELAGQRDIAIWKNGVTL
ncbi:UxaA family hydrolase [Oleisolibacter albus]|uniref:UxaA family hydrolase n=1 Tax=Oleisolibacter albus TaxID=2171757 RepID=UPI000DF43AB2|nr:altronate dehydratase family protein [Oleisolibacter albus]